MKDFGKMARKNRTIHKSPGLMLAVAEQQPRIFSPMLYQLSYLTLLVAKVASTVAASQTQQAGAMDRLAFWAQMVEDSRQMLLAGQSLVHVFLHCYQNARAFYEAHESAPEKALQATRTMVEAIGSSFESSVENTQDDDRFLDAVMADFQFLQSGPPIGASGALFPATLPAQFFAEPEAFLSRTHELRDGALKVLWDETLECEGELPAGTAHTGFLKDGRPYLVLRMPPPHYRFEAHFVAMVGAGESSPPRMFAMERGVTPEHTVLAEIYHDGRLRLGQAGPAESKNFIYLVRQQLVK